MSNSVSRQTTNHVPEPVARVADLMSTFAPPWALCGGWAVDAWLGRKTRDHPDVDLFAFVQDQRAIFRHLAGWQLVAHDHTETHRPWDGRHLDLPNHIQASLDPDQPLAIRVAEPQQLTLDFQLNDRLGDECILSREPSVTMPLRRAVQQSAWSLPTLVPEVLLFYKATAYFGREELMTGGRYQDEPDFLTVLPHLSEEGRSWLREAISLVAPGHPWLAEISP